jgi:hypothetical protein
MITDELMAQENWRNKADRPIKINKEKKIPNDFQNIQVHVQLFAKY